MIARSISRINSAAPLLTFQPCAPIVIGFKRRRSIFDMTNYQESWLPRSKPYHKNRKPRQAQWSDPNFFYPILIPPLRKMTGRPREYIKQIEQQEKEKIERQRDFLLPDVRSGDIVEISYQETLEDEKVVKYKGYVIAVTKKNTLMAGLVLAIRIAGVNVQAHYLIHSPKVKNIEIAARGSGNLKSRLYFLWDRGYFTKSFIQQPWKGKANKPRKDEAKKVTTKKSGTLKMDHTEDDSVRKIL